MVETRKEIKIGLLGHGFMGKTHSHAYRTIKHKYKDSEFTPKLYVIAGLRKDATESAAIQYGFEKWTTNWKEVVYDPVIDVIDVCLPENMHEEACIKAIKTKKHVFCEKPLALNTKSCKRILDVAEEKKVKTMCGFNYRFIPAIRFAKEIIDNGKIGKIYYIRANYSQESGHNPKRPADQIRYLYGKKPLGTIRGLGSHLIDTVRYLCGDIHSVNAIVKTMLPERPLSDAGNYQVHADDIAVLNIELKNGGIGSLTASALATGRKNQLAFEINGSKGSISFDLEKLNSLSVYYEESKAKNLRGFTEINVTENFHPLTEEWWPPAHIHGWETGHINELHYFLKCIHEDKPISPVGATFYDGYIAANVAEAAFRSTKSGEKVYLNNK
jgi:predicted dehydrogenase